MNSTLGSVLKAARKKAGLRQIDLAEKSGFSLPTIYRWERGERQPRVDDINKLADALNVPVSYLMGDKEIKVSEQPKGNETSNIRDSITIEKNTLRIAVLSSMNSICCGEGYDMSYVDEEVIRHELVPEEWLRGHPKSPFKPFIVYVDGDSMEPKIDDGERILVNPNEREIINEKVYVVKWNDRKKVRKIILQRNGDIILRAYNPAYKDDIVLAEDAEYTFEICGRVVRYLGLDRPAD